MYTVYCHVFPNGKKYIGLTRTSVERRWGHGGNYKTCPLLFRAIKKYGWESVEHIVLAEVSSLEEAEQREREFISTYKTQDPSFGYNILPGGDVSDNCATEEMRYKLGNGWRGKQRSKVEKRKISRGVKKVFTRAESNGHFGLSHSLISRGKMSMSHTEKWANDEKRRTEASLRMIERMADSAYKAEVLERLSQYKRKPGEWKMPEQAKAKLSEQTKGKWIGDKSPCSKPVLQYTVNGDFIKRWANAGEVERAGIASRSNVSKCCRGVEHVKTVGGFVWRFEE